MERRHAYAWSKMRARGGCPHQKSQHGQLPAEHSLFCCDAAQLLPKLDQLGLHELDGLALASAGERRAVRGRSEVWEEPDEDELAEVAIARQH